MIIKQGEIRMSQLNTEDNSKEGEWEYSPQENIAICSKCKYEHYLGTYHQYATNYCPNCGTKMKPVK